MHFVWERTRNGKVITMISRERPVTWFNMNMSFYRYDQFHWVNKTICKNHQQLYSLFNSLSRLTSKYQSSSLLALYGGNPSARRTSLTMEQLCGKRFHVMMSSWMWFRSIFKAERRRLIADQSHVGVDVWHNNLARLPSVKLINDNFARNSNIRFL